MATLLALVLLISGPPKGVPPDFAIKFEFGLCWHDVVDTSKDVYARDLVIDDQAQTVPLRLSDAQWRDLARWVGESKFFDLPDELSASEDQRQVDGMLSMMVTIPSPTYVVSIQSSGRSHRVEFDDDNATVHSDRVNRVRKLVERMERFFTSLPQVKPLPKPPVGCL